MMWYYVRDGERVGPVDETAVSQLINDGSIAPQTQVWKEGMTDWLGAAQTELSSQFAGVPPAVRSLPGPAAAYSAPVVPYGPESLRKYWLWFAWLMGVGFPLCFVVIGIFPLIAAAVIGYILLYRFWTLIQDGAARTTPGKAVGFCFIPFFNFYWYSVAYVGLSKDMNAYCDDRQIPGPRVSEGLALTWYILFLCTMIPYVGLLVSVGVIVIQIILMKQFADVGMSILRHRNAGQ